MDEPENEYLPNQTQTRVFSRRAAAPSVATINCDCGGKMSPVIIESLRTQWITGAGGEAKNVDGWRCDTCGGSVPDGRAVNAIMRGSKRRPRDASLAKMVLVGFVLPIVLLLIFGYALLKSASGIR